MSDTSDRRVFNDTTAPVVGRVVLSPMTGSPTVFRVTNEMLLTTERNDLRDRLAKLLAAIDAHRGETSQNGAHRYRRDADLYAVADAVRK